MASPRVDDRRVLSGIIFINRNGLRWRDAPKEYGPAKTLYNRWKRWSDNGVFARIMVSLATESAEHKTIMIDVERGSAIGSSATARVSESPSHSIEPAVEKGGCGRLIGRTKGFGGSENCPGDSFPGERNTKLHAVTDTNGRPIRFFMTAGQVSDYVGAAELLSSLPKADWLLADRGYDADWFREAPKNKGASPVSRAGSPEASPSHTTSAATDDGTALRSCSAGSKIGGASQLDTTDARKSSSPPSHSPQPSCSGYEP
ncbi:IS5 family transposase [Paracoccus caeni]